MEKQPKRLSVIGTFVAAIRQPLCRQGKSTKFFRKNIPKDATHNIKTVNVLHRPLPPHFRFAFGRWTQADTLPEDFIPEEQKSAVLVEFSAVLAENSTSTADFGSRPDGFLTNRLRDVQQERKRKKAQRRLPQKENNKGKSHFWFQQPHKKAQKKGYRCIPTLLTLNLILWKTRCKSRDTHSCREEKYAKYLKNLLFHTFTHKNCKPCLTLCMAIHR